MSGKTKPSQCSLFYFIFPSSQTKTFPISQFMSGNISNMHISNQKQSAPQENIPSETQSSSRSTTCNFNTTTLIHVGSLPSSFSKTKHANRMFWIVPQGKRGDMKMPVSSCHWGELHVQNRIQYEYSGPRIQCFGYYRRENAVL